MKVLIVTLEIDPWRALDGDPMEAADNIINSEEEYGSDRIIEAHWEEISDETNVTPSVDKTDVVKQQRRVQVGRYVNLRLVETVEAECNEAGRINPPLVLSAGTYLFRFPNQGVLPQRALSPQTIKEGTTLTTIYALSQTLRPNVQ